MGTETTTTQRFVKELNSISPRAKFIVKEAARNRAHPDIIGCVDGEMWIIENKTEDYWKNRPGHKLQLKELRDWKTANARVFMPKTNKDREEIYLKIKAIVNAWCKPGV